MSDGNRPRQQQSAVHVKTSRPGQATAGTTSRAQKEASPKHPTTHIRDRHTSPPDPPQEKGRSPRRKEHRANKESHREAKPRPSDGSLGPNKPRTRTGGSWTQGVQKPPTKSMIGGSRVARAQVNTRNQKQGQTTGYKQGQKSKANQSKTPTPAGRGEASWMPGEPGAGSRAPSVRVAGTQERRGKVKDWKRVDLGFSSAG